MSPLISGWIADKTGSYNASFAVTFVVIVVGIVLALAAKPPVVPAHYADKELPSSPIYSH
ncbi:hypothetical protein [Metasolibacillus sp.]|uniref:hypothetical protein n=1 Tax=Metasolibacillus sp. TaxID=2703680 RepID=UPI00260099C0|nr:hypothetical protein [Metasolibacillus sp.]MCT6925207.1 MFS transporter [Metasolibacillus sp.]MCT6941435.1 MFS transporter [Metasolibacillus sp.]